MKTKSLHTKPNTGPTGTSASIRRKTLTAHIMGAILLYGSMVSAAEVKGRVADNTSGRLLGGWSGFLLGGAAGGPAGALAGGLISAWGGAKLQQASDLSGDAYEVQSEDGTRQVVRSPNRQWQIGDQVEVVGNRLRAKQASQPTLASH